MKPLLTLLALLMLFCTAARAEFKFPPGVFRISQLNEAMDKADKEKKPLFFVLGHDQSTESADLDVLRDTLTAGDKWAVTVFVSLNEQLEMPPVILTAMSGGYLPMGFISTPEADKLWKFIHPPTSPVPRNDMKKTVRTAIDECKAEIAQWAKAARPVPPEQPGNKELQWPKKDNTSAQDAFSKLKDGKVYFSKDREDVPGLSSGTPLENFRPATVRYIKFITGTTAPAKETADPRKPAPAPEKWTNAQGKSLTAAFVSLKDGKVTLRTAAGVEHVLALATLSAESQARAKELAAEKPNAAK